MNLVLFFIIPDKVHFLISKFILTSIFLPNIDKVHLSKPNSFCIQFSWRYRRFFFNSKFIFTSFFLPVLKVHLLKLNSFCVRFCRLNIIYTEAQICVAAIPYYMIVYWISYHLITNYIL